MRDDIAGVGSESSGPTWEVLEAWVRERAQALVQGILEEEVTELLGRRKWERKGAVDAPAGYRNGYGKPRRLAMSSGTITVRRPRARGLEERFESRVLPLFLRRTREVGALLPELYLHGLAEGDFELAMRGLLGEGAPLSKPSIRRLRGGWTEEFGAWSRRPLEDREIVYMWADGIYVKAGLERDKAAVLVVIGAMRDGSKEVPALVSGYRESVESWSGVLRDLKARGSPAPGRRRQRGDLGRGTESGLKPASSGAGTTRRGTCSTGCHSASRPRRRILSRRSGRTITRRPYSAEAAARSALPATPQAGNLRARTGRRSRRVAGTGAP